MRTYLSILTGIFAAQVAWGGGCLSDLLAEAHSQLTFIGETKKERNLTPRKFLTYQLMLHNSALTSARHRTQQLSPTQDHLRSWHFVDPQIGATHPPGKDHIYSFLAKAVHFIAQHASPQRPRESYFLPAVEALERFPNFNTAELYLPTLLRNLNHIRTHWPIKERRTLVRIGKIGIWERNTHIEIEAVNDSEFIIHVSRPKNWPNNEKLLLGLANGVFHSGGPILRSRHFRVVRSVPRLQPSTAKRHRHFLLDSRTYRGFAHRDERHTFDFKGLHDLSSTVESLSKTPPEVFQRDINAYLLHRINMRLFLSSSESVFEKRNWVGSKFHKQFAIELLARLEKLGPIETPNQILEALDSEKFKAHFPHHLRELKLLRKYFSAHITGEQHDVDLTSFYRAGKWAMHLPVYLYFVSELQTVTLEVEAHVFYQVYSANRVFIVDSQIVPGQISPIDATQEFRVTLTPSPRKARTLNITQSQVDKMARLLFSVSQNTLVR